MQVQKQVLRFGIDPPGSQAVTPRAEQVEKGCRPRAAIGSQVRWAEGVGDAVIPTPRNSNPTL